MPTLSLVIPAYNEEERLPALLDVLRTSAPAAASAAGFELVETLIVDDGSTDGTRATVEAATAGEPTLRLLAPAGGNRGKGAAVASGVREAVGEWTLLADVDLSTPLEELTKLAAAVEEGADLAVGSRHLPGATVERGPAHRKLTGRGFSLMVRSLTGLDVQDTQNGFKLLPTEAGRRLFAEQRCTGFAFDVELLMRAKLAGMRIAEIPVLYIHDSRSRVRVGSASVSMLREILGLRDLRAARPSPLSQAAGRRSP